MQVKIKNVTPDNVIKLLDFVQRTRLERKFKLVRSFLERGKKKVDVICKEHQNNHEHSSNVCTKS